MKEALFYTSREQNKVVCTLCPHNCLIREGERGLCKVRVNKNGKLITLVYNKVSALHFDPIEKKPLYHFYPGKQILSVGSFGCNFKCPFCQNDSISQTFPEEAAGGRIITPEQIVEEAQSLPNNIGIAYTYNEPITFYEYMSDCAQEAHSQGLKNVVVSNGFINEAPLKKLLPFTDAFNIDLKAFNNTFYRKQAKGELKPVLDTIQTIVQAGKHLEVTFLVIPGLNDDPEEFTNMVRWIAEKAGSKVPLHISRYFPAYKQINPPTPVSTLENFYTIATGILDYVFLGNVSFPDKSDTFCPGCGKVLIKREGYRIHKNKYLNGPYCLNCGAETGIIDDSRV